MPLYDYECAAHGVFDAIVPMSAYRQPQPCPRCRGASPRVFLTAAALARMPAPLRKAHAVNDASRHSPKSSAQLKHGASCQCCSGSRIKTGNAASGPRGERGFPGTRPWMISH
jgi:putative FmdB family regulatory protein